MSEAYGRAKDNRVVITGVDMDFGQLVVFILKVMLASIPAYIILILFFAMLAGIFGGVLAGLAGLGGAH